jgi:hypothetical protein
MLKIVGKGWHMLASCFFSTFTKAQVILHDAKWPADRVDRALNLPSRPSSLQQLVDALYAA